MKAQFKYSFLTGFHTRGPLFAAVAAMMLVFGVLGSLDLLPEAAHITAVSLGGCSIAAVLAVGVVSDVTIARRMLAAPDAYLYALTPTPRRKTLLASIITMMVLDVVTMAAVIAGEVWLSFNFTGVGDTVRDEVRANMTSGDLWHGFWLVMLLLAGYLLYMLIILFGVAMKKSAFFKKPFSGLLGFLSACGCVYAVSLLNFLLAPFSVVWRYGIFFTIEIGGDILPAYFLLTLLAAAGMFALTSRQMERKMNL